MKLLRLILILLFVGTLSGCAPKKQGTRTTEYALDGKTVIRVTETFNDQERADVSREKTRQLCYTADEKRKAIVQKVYKENPLALAMIAQTNALKNAMSLLATGKNYDPCPSSTNTQDAAIASSHVWETFWDRSFSFGKVAVGAIAGVKIADSMFAATAGAATAYNFNNTGDGGINLTDSLNSTEFGNLEGIFGDWWSRSPVTTNTETSYAP